MTNSYFNRDLYKILETKKEATQDEIRKAFQKLAHKYHPDKNNGDDVKFKEVNSAYQILGNIAFKERYDEYINEVQNNKNESHEQSGEIKDRENFTNRRKGNTRANNLELEDPSISYFAWIIFLLFLGLLFFSFFWVGVLEREFPFFNLLINKFSILFLKIIN